MKQFMIGYIILSAIILVMIYFTTIIITTNTEATKLKTDLLTEGATLKDMESFVKYSSLAYKRLDQIDANPYTIDIYQTIAKNNDVYLNQLTIFVIAEGVNYASSIHDENDQTSLTISKNDGYLYQSNMDENYQDYALSYGIGKAGVYYYTIEIQDFLMQDLMFYDYHGDLITTLELSYENQDYTEENPLDFLPRYTTDVINEMLELTPKIRTEMLKNYALFLAVDLLIGAFLYLFMKWKKI